jgi:inorganic triphosphatase YgiF
MTETELKFQVPAAARAGLRRAVDTATATTTRLRARYFDTADRRLAAAGVALRLRQEGRVWVQTLKGPGAGPVQRLEHEVRLSAAAPTLDLGRHHDTPAGALLQQALGRDAPPLQLVFETDVRRTQRVLRLGAARIELALDQGLLRAAGRHEPLFELELELQQGPVAALYTLAARWVQRHGLWLDVRSKAERGELLASGQAARAATGALVPPLQPLLAVDAALRQMVGAALAQALPNAAALAGAVAEPEHLHQLRVALRRLRSALRLFGGSLTGADPAWPEALAQLFRALGSSRDDDVLAGSVLPALAAAGGPHWSLLAGDARAGVGAVLRDAPTTLLLLSLLAYADGEPLAAVGPTIRDLAARRLRRLDRRLAQQAAGYAGLELEQRHWLRRQIKRLRYGVEATQTIWPAKSCRRYLAGLRPIQDALGQYNDLLVAGAWLDRAPTSVRDDAVGCAFARGWLAARQQQALDAAAACLGNWPRRPRAW